MNIFTPCARSCGGNSVGGLNKNGNNCFCLYLAVVSGNGVNNIVVLLVFFSGLNAKLNMRAFKLTVKSLTYIVEKSGTLCRLNIGAQLCRHKPCDIRNLQRMVKYILTVACAVSQFTEQLNKLGMNAVYPCVNNGSFTCLFNCMLNLTL